MKEMENLDILLCFKEDGRRGDHGKEAYVPDTGSSDEDICIFPAKEEQCGELIRCQVELLNAPETIGSIIFDW